LAHETACIFILEQKKGKNKHSSLDYRKKRPVGKVTGGKKASEVLVASVWTR